MKGFYNRRAFLKDPTQHGAAPKAKSFNRSLFASGRRGFGVDGTTAAGDAASERNLSLAAGAASPAAATARGERVMSVAIRTSCSLGATVRWDGGGSLTLGEFSAALREVGRNDVMAHKDLVS